MDSGITLDCDNYSINGPGTTYTGKAGIEVPLSADADNATIKNCTIVNLNGMALEVQKTIAGKLLKKLYESSTTRKFPPFYELCVTKSLITKNRPIGNSIASNG